MGAWDAPPAHRWRKRLQQLAARAGFHVGRMPPNRFDAMEAVLAWLAQRGFSPRIVIDAGANAGDWTRLARAVFPAAEVHLFEPQLACRPRLEALQRADPHVHLHTVALTRPGVAEVRMAGAGSTGAWVMPDHLAEAVETIRVPASTLDREMAAVLTRSARPLLKLDVEGHELDLLAGAGDALLAVEAIVTEVRFYDIERDGHPTFADVLEFLRAHGFELCDVVMLGSRRRDGRLRIGDVLFVR
jgi:FkbM family methyltransferase